MEDNVSISSHKTEYSDEFLRNFFIKFGMKKTLDSFQQEWFELKAKGSLDMSRMPLLPEIYRVNAELSDELTALALTSTVALLWPIPLIGRIALEVAP